MPLALPTALVTLVPDWIASSGTFGQPLLEMRIFAKVRLIIELKIFLWLLFRQNGVHKRRADEASKDPSTHDLSGRNTDAAAAGAADLITTRWRPIRPFLL